MPAPVSIVADNGFVESPRRPTVTSGEGGGAGSDESERLARVEEGMSGLRQGHTLLLSAAMSVAGLIVAVVVGMIGFQVFTFGEIKSVDSQVAANSEQLAANSEQLNVLTGNVSDLTVEIRDGFAQLRTGMVDMTDRLEAAISRGPQPERQEESPVPPDEIDPLKQPPQ